MEYQNRLYMILHPTSALIGSQYTPEQLARHYTVGPTRHYRGKVLFAEVDGQPAGWFPAVPNLNEVFIHLNGLRYPWDYLRLLKYGRVQPKSLAIKSVAVPPEYRDTGVGVLLFDEMARRAAANH